MKKITHHTNIIILFSGLFLLGGCSQNMGAMSLKPNHTEDSNGFALTLSKKEVGNTINEMKQNYSNRLSGR